MGQSICVVTPMAMLLGPVSGQQDCRNCYQLDTGTLVGIIVGDIVLSVLIALSIFCFVYNMKKKKRTLDALEGKGKKQTSSKIKTEDAESTYQELQGVQSDIYNDLTNFRK
ncbi:TYRO protein tyrosine kinase-binding protein [Scleropages formosus]|uniref:TYRO protein tyrosine kinase-binding protein n=1 Tax=Scleropages formosus TaxID=113540 RepID=A0A8C9R346_SCLFO|nr:TYRO protein tyrosine kinase-binding protein [Scleropages formosus]